jgi:hypothetical protein
MPKFTVGTRRWLRSQTSTCVREPPKLRLCGPFSQLNVSSTSHVYALRELGVGALLASLMSKAPQILRSKPP